MQKQKAEGITEYIYILKDAQRKAELAKILASKDYVHTMEDWEALVNAQKMWTKWKSSFRITHLAHKRQLLVSGGATHTHAGHMQLLSLAPPATYHPAPLTVLMGTSTILPVQ